MNENSLISDFKKLESSIFALNFILKFGFDRPTLIQLNRFLRRQLKVRLWIRSNVKLNLNGWTALTNRKQAASASSMCRNFCKQTFECQKLREIIGGYSKNTILRRNQRKSIDGSQQEQFYWFIFCYTNLVSSRMQHPHAWWMYEEDCCSKKW